MFQSSGLHQRQSLSLEERTVEQTNASAVDKTRRLEGPKTRRPEPEGPKKTKDRNNVQHRTNDTR